MNESKREKYLDAGILCLLPVLLYGLIGPLEIYVGNRREFEFPLKEIFPVFLLVSVIIWLVGSMVLAMLPKKISVVLEISIFTFSFLSYLQNMFLNTKLMNGNGTGMEWAAMKNTMVINLVLWIVIAAGCISIPFIVRDKYLKIYIGISAFISAVQIITIISLMFQVNGMECRNHDSTQIVLDVSNQLKLSGNDNIIVLVFDSLDNQEFENGLLDDADFVNELKDFTYYDNADSHYAYTFPSMFHIMTGMEYNPDVAQFEWAKACWNTERSLKFYEKMHALGYECDLYEDVSQIPKQQNGNFDNVVEERLVVNKKSLFFLLEKMTLYKYVPYVCKPYFEVFGEVTDQVYMLENEERYYYENYKNGIFYSNLLNHGLQIDESITNKFCISRIRGIHWPYETTSDGRFSETETSVEETLDGIGVIITEYLAQLKELEIYDSATIIIMADHGRREANNFQITYLIKTPNVHQEEMKICSAPISHDDFQATIMDILGQDYTGYGTSIFNWSEDDERPRELWVDAGDLKGFWVYNYTGNREELQKQMNIEGGGNLWLIKYNNPNKRLVDKVSNAFGKKLFLIKQEDLKYTNGYCVHYILKDAMNNKYILAFGTTKLCIDHMRHIETSVDLLQREWGGVL